jgi:hypothetical protein
MAIIRGPFNVKWGANTLLDIEEIEVEHEIDSEDFETIQGRTIEIDGAYKASVTLTLLASDIAALAVVLPQHYVADAGTMSTGEIVDNEDGAIDVVPHDCDQSLIYNDLEITSCANPGTTLRLVNARTKLEGIDIDNKIQKVMVKFIGEAPSAEATIQWFAAGSLNIPS